MAWSIAQKKYYLSSKGKEARRRYQESDKGKQTHREYLAKRKAKRLEAKQTKEINPVNNEVKEDKIKASTSNISKK